MHPHEQLITDFYTAFQKRDAEGMVACYHPEIAFSDPAFPDLKGERACGMWRMLCGRAKEFELTFDGVEADDEKGKARWEASYVFSQTGNKVLNKVEAHFRFKDGKIIEHTDRFSFHTWAGQALGLPGKLLGWFGPFQGAVQKKAGRGLDLFMAKS